MKARPGIDFGTHDYIGADKCGCVVAVVCDMPGDPRGTAKSVADFIRSGLVVTRISHEEFRSKRFGRRPDCDCMKKPEVPQSSLFEATR